MTVGFAVFDCLECLFCGDFDVLVFKVCDLSDDFPLGVVAGVSDWCREIFFECTGDL